MIQQTFSSVILSFVLVATVACSDSGTSSSSSSGGNTSSSGGNTSSSGGNTSSSGGNSSGGAMFECKGAATCNVTTTDGVLPSARIIYDAPGGACGFADPVTRASLRIENGTVFEEGKIVGNYTRDNTGFPTSYGYQLQGKTIQLSQCRR